MIHEGEDLLKCDLAETYHLYVTDWDAPPLPLSYIADLSAGLGVNSRIKRKIANMELTLEQTLLALAVDKLAVLIWQKTKDGKKGRNVPESVLAKLTGRDKKKDDLQVFRSVEDFQEWYERKHHV
jgi:hypothetical protein